MGSSPHYCAGCNDKIFDQWILMALEKSWHENCLRCTCCRVKLDDISNKLFYRNGMMLCRDDYVRLFGNGKNCNTCNEKIPAGMMIMRARENVYHMNCFKCTVCNMRLIPGDRFYTDNDRLLCEYDYQETRVFQMAAVSNVHLEEISKNLQELGEFEVDEHRQN